VGRCYARAVSEPSSDLRDQTFANGLRVVIDPMPHLPTLSATLQLPIGSVIDPEGGQGCAVVLHEWIQRGAGDRDARAQADAFDRHGAQRGGGIGRETAAVSVACLARDIAAVLPLVAASVIAPRLAADEFEGARQLALQELASLDDAPVQRLAEAAVRARYESAHGRSAYGERRHLERLRPATVRRQARSRLVPHGAVLALAGGGDPDALLAMAAEAFGTWSGRAEPLPVPVLRPGHRHHLTGEGAQTQIAVIDDAVAPGAPGWTEQALAMAVLAGGMGSRLSSEVRERRGLAYAVSSSVQALAGDAYRFTYAGTTPERAGETIEVLLDELERWRAGIDAGELERARAQLRSSLVLSSESSGARAHRMAGDVHRFGRPRSLAEVLGAIDAADLGSVNDFLATRPASVPTIVTSGPLPRQREAAA
jgi:predicted Zn-dependent peptidase